MGLRFRLVSGVLWCTLHKTDSAHSAIRSKGGTQAWKQRTTQIPRRAFVLGTAAVGVLAAANPTFAFADEVADKQAQADAALASLNAMQDSLNEKRPTNTTTPWPLSRKPSRSGSQDNRHFNGEISDNQSKLATRVRGMYRTGSSTIIDVLTGSTSFEEFATGLSLINDMNQETADLVSATKDSRDALEQAKAEYAAQEQTASQKADEAQQAVNDAQDLVTIPIDLQQPVFRRAAARRPAAGGRRAGQRRHGRSDGRRFGSCGRPGGSRGCAERGQRRKRRRRRFRQRR